MNSHSYNSAGKLMILVVALSVMLACSSTFAASWYASYTVTFDATWSADTHPVDFPANPHFSGLIGGNHNDNVAFWEVGELATLGIKRMAEWGSITPLDEEVEAAILAGNAGAVIAGPWIPNSPATVSHDFLLNQEFPLVTLVSMIAPSPDWFVGVSGLNLFQDGAWVEELVVELLPYDAGTDSGPSYASPNQPTVPPENISLKTDGPFTGGVPLGTFTFTYTGIPADVPTVAGFEVRNFPNPFNPKTTVAYNMPAPGVISATIYDLQGKLIRVLLNQPVSEGPGSVEWDGRNRSGRKVPAGSYLLRVSALDLHTDRKLTLVQ